MCMDSVKYHHSAIARGYVRVGHQYDEEYNGRFGSGYIRHYESKLGVHGRPSTSYHTISYFIKED